MLGTPSLALAGLRARGSRTLLSALGILAASLVVGTGVTVGYGLATGFERSADSAGLPDVIARFDPERRTTVDERVRALPNLETASYRYEVLNAPLTANGHHNHRGAVNTIGEGRRGYEILDGRDLVASRPGEAVVEQGLAKEWDLHPGDRIRVGRELGRADDRGHLELARQRRLPARHDRARLRLRRDDPRAARLHARRRQRRAAVAARPGQGRRDAHAGARGVVRARQARVRHPRGRARAALAGRRDRDLAARRVLAGRARRRRDDARRGRARRRPAAPERVRRAARARLLAGADRGAAGHRGGDRGRAGGARGAGDRDAGGRGALRRAAGRAQRAPARRRAGRCRWRSRSSPCWRSSSPPRPGPRGVPRAARRRRSCAAATWRRAATASEARGGLLGLGARFSTAARGRFARVRGDDRRLRRAWSC